MKKLTALLLIAVFMLAGCKKDQSNDEIPDVKIVGISKIIAHPALDAVERGVIDELTEQRIANVMFDLQSANGEIATASSIAAKYKKDGVTVAVGIATPMALTLAGSLKNTPVVFSAVTDPVDAGLRKNNDSEDSLISGVSDMVPIREQVKLIKALTNARIIGHMYNAGESNSVVTLRVLEEVCKEQGIELVVTTVTNTSEVKQATEVLCSKGVNAIYVSTDNIVAAAIASVTTTATRHKVPVIGADPVTAANTGALAAYGVDYYKAGRFTGKIVIQILNGAKPGNIPVKFMTGFEELALFVDKDVALELGIDVPDNIEDLVK